MASQLVRVPVVRNKAYRPHGLKSYVYALNKYGISPTQPSIYQRPQGSKFLVKKQQDGSQGQVGADDQMNDAFYTCPVQIGNPAQTVDLDFDSGSSDMWVWSTALDSATQAAGESNSVKIFNAKASSTFKQIPGSTWQISYGDGSGASGTVGTDTIDVGGIKIDNQAVELATQLSSSFQNQTSSGLLGLAWGHINTVKPDPVKTLVDNMISQGKIDNPLWTVYLGSVKDVNDPDHGKSFFTFGSIDDTLVKASGQEIAYTPIDNSDGFWKFDAEEATVNGKTILMAGNKAIADTGTTLMLCSDDFCKALYSAIDGAKYDQQAGGWVLPAQGVKQRPEVKVSVGKNAFITIEKEQLGWADLDDGSGMVYGAIQSRGDNEFDIWGDTFLFCCYAIFDVGNEQFGVVQRADPTPDGQ